MVMDLLVASEKEPAGDVSNSLEIAEFRILREVEKARSRIQTLDGLE